MQPVAGILGIGAYLPEAIRYNDWWPESIVARWRENARHGTDRLPLPLTDGVTLARAAMSRYADDPFNGALQRHVMDSDELSSDMELVAARRAIAQARVDPRQIDALISFTSCPDYLCGPTGASLHQRLELPAHCLTFSIDVACNSFPVQLTLADQLIRTGSARHVLLVQSAAFSRLMPAEAPLSAAMGDGATAVVVGSVRDGHGVLSSVHGTDGTRSRAVVFGIPGKRWYEEGKVICYSADPPMGQALVLGSVDRARQLIPEVLEKAGVSAAEVDFYACHQGGPWLREVTQRCCRLDRARTIDTYAMFGSLSGANLPLVMAMGQREGLLRDGHLVLMFSQGTGETYSAVLVRWGGQ